MNNELPTMNSKMPRIFEYFQKFSNVSHHFSNIFKYFQTFRAIFRMFSNVFERFYAARLAQPLYLNTPIPIFTPKTHIHPQN